MNHFFLMADLGLRLTRLPWRSFWDAHTPALALAAAAGLLAGGATVALRALGAPSLELLFATLAVTVGGMVLIVWSAPGLFLAGDWVGPDGWLSDASLASGEHAGLLAATAARNSSAATATSSRRY